MVFPNISTGSLRKRGLRPVPRLDGRPQSAGFSVSMMTTACAAMALHAAAALAQQPQLLEPERAFAFSARGIDRQTVEARFVVAKGYYLYRDKLKFTVEPDPVAGPAVLPPGQVKEDQFFGKVETYRGELVGRLALATAAPGTKVSVAAKSQGCADLGVCSPPQVQRVTLVLPAAGA